MEMTPAEKERMLEICKVIWPDAEMDEHGEIVVPFSVVIPSATVSSDAVRAARRLPRPTADDLPSLVAKAQTIITFNGGTPSRPAPKRQQVDELSYSYGVLWGIACALNCSLREIVEKFGTSSKKRTRTPEGGGTEHQDP